MSKFLSNISLCIMTILIPFLITLFLFASGAPSKKNFYRAAVLELAQFDDVSYPPIEILGINLRKYELAARTAAQNEADIIVFPESGLLPFEKPSREWIQDFIEDTPDPRQEVVNPCTQTSAFKNRPILSNLSCIAKSNHIYVVANTVDLKECKVDKSCDKKKSNCSSCPDDGHFFYNTNVVFNKDGTLIAKYYKRHLYFEPEMNEPDFPEDAFFDTEFGNFTTVICFDLMFEEAVRAVEKSGVLNVAYPTYWFDHVPHIYFAAAYQQAWAIANKVNLLAANGHHPKTGSLGSGIYSPKLGALIYTHNPDGRSKLLISNVPKFPFDDSISTPDLDPKLFYVMNETAIFVDGKEIPQFKKGCEMIEDSDDEDYQCGPTSTDHYLFKKLQGNEGLIEICSNSFCCSLFYQANSMDEEFYFGVTGEDLNFYGHFMFGTQSCFLARCDSVKGQPCVNYILKSQTVFRKVEIKGNFSTSQILPFAVDSDVRLTDKNKWHFDDKSEIIYDNLNEKSSLVFLGLYGRLFERDENIYHQPDSAWQISGIQSWLIIILGVHMHLNYLLKV